MRTNRSLFFTMILYYSIISICSLAILGGIMFYFVSKMMRTEIVTHSQKILAQSNMSLDNYFSDVVTSLEMVSLNPIVVSSMLTYDQDSSYTQNLKYKQITDQFRNIMSLKRDISNILIFNPNMSVTMTPLNLKSPFLQKVWDLNQGMQHISPIFFPTHSPDYYTTVTRSGNVVSMSYPIRDIEHFESRNLAICLIDFNFDKIKQIIENSKLGMSDSIILISNDGSVIYSTDLKYYGNGHVSNKLDIDNVFHSDTGNFNATFQSEKLLVNYSTSNVTGWKLVYLSKTSEIQKNVEKTATITIILVFIVIVLSIIISVFISRKSSKPIHELMNHMREVGRGNFSIRIAEVGNYSEFKILNGGFNLMMDKINTLFDEVYTGKMKQKEAEFKALQANIQPHFLNNTLQVIYSLAILERTRDIEKVVTALGNLLEYVIYNNDKKVLIFKEISYISDYLHILNLRYENTIQVKMDIEEGVYRSYILKLLLQPLVENAVQHGLDKIAGERKLLINGYTKESNIHFEIIDNGIGMTEQRCNEVVQNLKNNLLAESSIGLSNVQERIQAEYGVGFGIHFYSEYGKGTKVELIIPLDNSK